jgi:nucleoside-diphosphate-sugar epimerase
MRYAVTGATGFVGGRLYGQLREAGHDVAALVRDPDRASALSAAGVRVVRGDVTDAAAVRALAAGVDGLFHVAGWYHLGRRDTAAAWHTNVEGTRTVLAAATEVAVPRVVYTSTLAVNSDTRGRLVDETYRFTGRHVSVYDETKAVAHEVAAGAGVPVVTVSPGMVYGPGDTSQTGALLRATMRGRRVVVPAGGRLCWGFVDDIAAGHVLAMERGRTGETYLLAGPPYALAEGLRLAAHLAGGPGPVVLPSALVRATAAVTAALGRVVPLPPMYAAETLRSSLATYLGSAAKAERELGWSARPLVDGLAAMLAAER